VNRAERPDNGRPDPTPVGEEGRGERLVREVMGPALVTLLPTTTVGEALRTLQAHHLHVAAVVTADGRLVGVISESDLYRGIRLPTLEAIDPAGCLHHRVPGASSCPECAPHTGDPVGSVSG